MFEHDIERDAITTQLFISHAICDSGYDLDSDAALIVWLAQFLEELRSRSHKTNAHKVETLAGLIADRPMEYDIKSYHHAQSSVAAAVCDAHGVVVEYLDRGDQRAAQLSARLHQLLSRRNARPQVSLWQNGRAASKIIERAAVKHPDNKEARYGTEEDT